MNRYVTALSLCCSLLAPLLAAAQLEELAPQLAKPESQAPMYEDIEIMRRLLHDKLQHLYPQPVRLWDATTGKQLGSTRLEPLLEGYISRFAFSAAGKAASGNHGLNGVTSAAFSPDGMLLATSD